MIADSDTQTEKIMCQSRKMEKKIKMKNRIHLS